MRRHVPRLRLDEIQAAVLRGNRLPAARLALLTVEDAAPARAFLGRLVADVTTAELWETPPEWTLTVGLTHGGLAALGVPAGSLAGFPVAFLEGMAARAADIGDVGADHPDRWELPGAPDGAAPVHVLLWLAAEERRADDELSRLLVAATGALRVVHVQEGAVLGTAGRRREHFGFVDGLSQPWIAGADPPRTALGRSGTWSARPLQPGEFVLGYPDEEGHPPPAPVPDVLARGGSYLVYRKLQQDVPGFRAFLREASADLGLEREDLAAKLVGRTPDGTPLVLPPSALHRLLAEDALAGNDFGFRDDPDGFRCPLGAHIRRVNPRDGLPFASKRVDRHRMVRRGIPYGPELPAGTEDDDPGAERGLLFLCFVADLVRQFEFVQRRWMDDGRVFGLGAETDPFVGHRADGQTMALPGRPPRYCRVPPQLVTLRWGEYFFVPSTTALAWISCLPG